MKLGYTAIDLLMFFYCISYYIMYVCYIPLWHDGIEGVLALSRNMMYSRISASSATIMVLRIALDVCFLELSL